MEKGRHRPYCFLSKTAIRRLRCRLIFTIHSGYVDFNNIQSNIHRQASVLRYDVRSSGVRDAAVQIWRLRRSLSVVFMANRWAAAARLYLNSPRTGCIAPTVKFEPSNTFHFSLIRMQEWRKLWSERYWNYDSIWVFGLLPIIFICDGTLLKN